LQRIILVFAGAVILILASGMVLARTGEAIAMATGLGSSFIGATLVATSTSLPELSTAITAVRIRNFDMAIANIFGSNTGMFVSLFLADVFYREGSMLEAADPSAHFNIVMGIVLTAVYIAGLMERREGTIFRMGYDSAVVLVLYVVSLFALYQLR
jgi:cation:H+ antiporter